MAHEVACRPELLVAPEWVRASLAAGECAIAGELQMNAAPRNAGEGAMEIVSQMSTQITRSVARGVGADPEGPAAMSGANIVADTWEAAKRKERAQERSYAEARAARFERQKAALAEAVGTGDVVVRVAAASAVDGARDGERGGIHGSGADGGGDEGGAAQLLRPGHTGVGEKGASARTLALSTIGSKGGATTASLLDETRAAALKSAERYERLLEKGRIAYEDKLWTDDKGGYFKYDTSVCGRPCCQLTAAPQRSQDKADNLPPFLHPHSHPLTLALALALHRTLHGTTASWPTSSLGTGTA